MLKVKKVRLLGADIKRGVRCPHLTLLQSICFLQVVFSLGIIQPAIAATGTLRGLVLDRSTNRPIGSVNVVLEDTLIGAATDLDGKFTILAIPVGTHNIRFSCLGYQTFIESDVFIRAGDHSELTVTLEPVPLEMDEVVVKPSFFKKSQDASTSFHNMDWAEIRIDPGSAEDVQRVVQALPSVVTGADQMNELIVRGGMPNENLFLMDHIEIANPNHFGLQGQGGGPINMLNNEFVREVDFYAGAFPACYGDKASSVMDIHLRAGNYQKYQGNVNLGMAGAGILVEGPIVKEKSSFMFSARRSFLDWVISSTGMTAVPEYHNLQSKIDIDLSPRHHLSLDGVYGHDYVKVEEGEDIGGYGGGNANEVLSRGDQIISGGTLTSLWGVKGISHLTLSHVTSRWDQSIRFDVTNHYYDKSSESETALKLEMIWALNPHHEISAGIQEKYVQFNINRSIGADTIFYWDTNFAQAQDDTIIGIFRTYAPWTGYGDVNSNKSGAYVQYTVKPMSLITLRTGLRWDYFDYNSAQNLSPRVSLSIQVASKTILNLAYGLHAQSPSYEELTRNLANRDLESKVTRHAVVGVEHQLRPDTKASVEIYYKDYRHVPIEVASTTPDPYDEDYGRMVNQGEGDSRGVEFFLQKKFSRNYHATLSYAYYRSRAVDPRTDEFYDWDYDYRHALTLIAGYRIRFGQKPWYQHLRAKWWYQASAWALPLADELELGIRWRYLGGRPYTAPIYHRELHTWVTEPDQEWNINRFPPYHRLDLRIDRRFFFNRWNLVTYFDIMNIYGRDNIWDYSRNEYGEVEEELQWQIFPVGGVMVEF